MYFTEEVKVPSVYPELLRKTEAIGFGMPADTSIGALLRILVASRPQGNFLELGTGTGLSLAWILEGMDDGSKVISLDNDSTLIEIAKEYLDESSGVELLCCDGEEWISTYQGEKFDIIFADTWPGKYTMLDETLDLLKEGGFYVVDDMLPQSNWPEGHNKKAKQLIKTIEAKENLTLLKMDWSTGILIAVKKK